MLIRKAPDLRYSEITPEPLYVERREFLRAASAGAIGALVGGAADAAAQVRSPGKLPRLPNVRTSPLSINEPPSTYDDITSYNNFYETGRFDAGLVDASKLKTRPWTVSVEGMVAKPASLDLDEFLKPHPLEERIYRHRCVETWSA